MEGDYLEGAREFSPPDVRRPIDSHVISPFSLPILGPVATAGSRRPARRAEDGLVVFTASDKP